MNFSFAKRPIPFVRVESSFVFNDDLPPSTPCASIREQLEGSKTVEADVKKAVESPEVVAHGPERGKSIIEEEVPVIIVPSSATTSTPPRDNIEENLVHVDQGFAIHDEEDSPIRPDDTPGDYYYYYRTYSKKRASDIHTHVWKLKQGDTFLDWQVCRD
ncbi:hypothetical protein Hanom_Chr15g01388621 [Helianthus anomalus]